VWESVELEQAEGSISRRRAGTLPLLTQICDAPSPPRSWVPHPPPVPSSITPSTPSPPLLPHLSPAALTEEACPTLLFDASTLSMQSITITEDQPRSRPSRAWRHPVSAPSYLLLRRARLRGSFEKVWEARCDLRGWEAKSRKERKARCSRWTRRISRSLLHNSSSSELPCLSMSSIDLLLSIDRPFLSTTATPLLPPAPHRLPNPNLDSSNSRPLGPACPFPLQPLLSTPLRPTTPLQPQSTTLLSLVKRTSS
jgi:hypothetical protein